MNTDNLGIAIILTTQEWTALPYPQAGISAAIVETSWTFRRLKDNEFTQFFEGKLFNKVSAVLITDYDGRFTYTKKSDNLYEIIFNDGGALCV